MNEKEISEIRRRFRADKSNITRIRGCYVNDKKEIVSQFNQSLITMSQDECEQILTTLKKTLSGTLGKNLIDIAFSNQQVLEGEEHRLLLALRDSSLEDDAAVTEFYGRVIETLTMEGCYLILLSCDKYDVFTYSEDGKKSEDSAEMFSYFLCSICPVKMTKPALSYFAYENTFHNIAANSVVSAPELGFMFPSFDDRAANIYNSLYYTRSTTENNDDFVDRIFKSKLPLPAAIQKETFETILNESVAEECDYEMVQAVHEQLSGMIEEHKQNKEEDPLTMNKKAFRSVLESCGVNEKGVAAFEEKYDSEFGSDTAVRPQNIVDTKRLEVRTADVTIKVNPERGDLLKTQIIDGTKYILIRADENVEVNGVNIHIS